MEKSRGRLSGGGKASPGSRPFCRADAHDEAAGGLLSERNDMKSKTDELYDLMLDRGYPEDFSRLICSEMNTDFTADRMMSYVFGEKHRLEDVADEMLAIIELRDRLVHKHVMEHAQATINELYRDINDDEVSDDEL